MNKLTQRLAAMLAEDRGNVLTEFVIVIPVVLLMFFGMLQYHEILKARQWPNYPPFEPPRVSAAPAPTEGDDQPRKPALKPAALAMAPVARLSFRKRPGSVGLLRNSFRRIF